MKPNSILFILDDDALTVANTGAPFSREGVISVCHMDLSEKGAGDKNTPIDDYGKYEDEKLVKCEDKELVAEIAERRVRTYREDINALMGDGNRENNIKRSYSGRFLWELLQNADDAVGGARDNSELIGSKGLGFKSVMEITREPEIYSGPFRFHFSRDESEKKLRESGVTLEQKGGRILIPACRIPHPKEPDEIVRVVRELLDDEYATVIRLPFAAGEKTEMRNKVRKTLNSLDGDCLLFCRRIESIAIQDGDARASFAIRSLPVGAARSDSQEAEITKKSGGESVAAKWRIWRKEQGVDGGKCVSAAVCLPALCKEMGGKQGKEKIIPCAEKSLLHVFFPTDENIKGARALIHASCEVDDSRKLVTGVQSSVCGALQWLVEKAIGDIPAETALLAFGKVDKNGVGHVSKLEGAIAATVRETPFIPVIGGEKEKPGNVRLWKHGLGPVLDADVQEVKDANLCDSQLADIDEAVSVLRGKLDAKPLGILEHAELLRFCRNETMKDCLDVWDVAQTLMAKSSPGEEKAKCAELLREVPFWRTNEGVVRALSDKAPLVWKKREECPVWLTHGVVDGEFEKGIRQQEGKRRKEADEKGAEWKNALSENGVYPLKKDAHFDGVLSPHCAKKTSDWWKMRGYEALQTAVAWWPESAKDAPLIINSGNAKEQRSKIFHLPVGETGGEWMPAWRVYAGPEWGGLKIIADYISKNAERGVLLPPEKWKIPIDQETHKQWGRLLSYLGCSWAPKLAQMNGASYCHRSGDNIYIRDYYFECFDDVAGVDGLRMNPDDYLGLLDIVQEMDDAARINHATSRVRGGTKRWEKDSSALLQLQEQKWVRCKRSVLFPGKFLFAPGQSYMPGRGLGGLLPEVDTCLFKEADGQKMLQIIKNLGAQDGALGDDQFVNYMRQLSECAKIDGANLSFGEQKGIISKATESLFSIYAKPLPKVAGDIPAPCIRYTDDGEVLYFEHAPNVYWADEPYFDIPEVRREILRENTLNVFFKFLESGGVFGLKKLSCFLDMKPLFGKPRSYETDILREKYYERRVVLVCAAKGAELPEGLKITAYDSITLRPSNPERANIAPLVRCHKADGEVAVNIGNGYDMWEGLGAALAELSGNSGNQAAFETLLREKNWGSCLRRLRDNYRIPEAALKPLEQNIVVVNHGEQTPEEDQIDTPIITNGSSTDGGSTKPDKEKGAFAEQVIYKWLKKDYPDLEWANAVSPDNPGYDFLLSVPGKRGDCYFEVKSFGAAEPPKSVQLSARQFQMAKEMGDRYRLCIIWNRDGKRWHYRSIRNPALLEKSNRISVRWTLRLPPLNNEGGKSD